MNILSYYIDPRRLLYLSVVIIYSIILIVINYPNNTLIFAGENFYYVLLGALEFPPRLFSPLLDGYFFLSRLFTAIAFIISKENLASISLIIGAIFHAYCGSYILRHEYSWLIDSLLLRFLISIVITFGPGSSEIIGSPVCVSYSATFFLLILMLKPEVLVSKIDKLLFIVCGFSSNFLILLVPVVLTRWYLSKDKKYLYVIFIIAVYSIFCLNLTRQVKMPFLRVDHTSLTTLDFYLYFQELFSDFFWQLFFVGYGTNSILALLILVLSLICVIYFLERKTRSLNNSELVLSLILTGFMFYFLHSVGRSYSVSHFSGRHGMMTITPTILALTIFVDSNILKSKYLKWKQVVMCSLIGLICYQSISLRNKTVRELSTDQIDKLQCIILPESNYECFSGSRNEIDLEISSGKLICKHNKKNYHCTATDQFGLSMEYSIPIN